MLIMKVPNAFSMEIWHLISSPFSGKIFCISYCYQMNLPKTYFFEFFFSNTTGSITLDNIKIHDKEPILTFGIKLCWWVGSLKSLKMPWSQVGKKARTFDAGVGWVWHLFKMTPLDLYFHQTKAQRAVLRGFGAIANQKV